MSAFREASLEAVELVKTRAMIYLLPILSLHYLSEKEVTTLYSVCIAYGSFLGDLLLVFTSMFCIYVEDVLVYIYIYIYIYIYSDCNK